MDEPTAKCGTDKTKEKIGHRRVTQEGTVTYKKRPTSELQKAIQLGIEMSISSAEKQPKRDVLLRDFGAIETIDLPRSGTTHIPAHSLSSDFRFRNFAPNAFRFFRDIYKVNVVDYMNSLCGHELRELSNPGASGSVFYISHDDEFIIKTVQHKESEFLQKLLPEYFLNLTQHPRTLLPKFYGLYCYQSLGKNIRIVVMNNLIPSSIKMHQKFDLKGSTHKRFASRNEKEKQSPTLKDLDFRELHPNGILLENETYDALTSTIARDCRVLESFRIMDYSLLLGIHNLDEIKREKQTTDNLNQSEMSLGPESDEQPAPGVTTGGGGQTSQTPTKTFSAQAAWNRSVKRIAAFSTALESIQAATEPVDLDQDEANNIPPGGIPARNNSGDRLLLYVGIIDILQSYRMAKKMEHTFKSIFHDPDTISVHNPNFYANRFQTFVCETVFRKVNSSMKQRCSLDKSVSGKGFQAATSEMSRSKESLYNHATQKAEEIGYSSHLLNGDQERPTSEMAAVG